MLPFETKYISYIIIPSSFNAFNAMLLSAQRVLLVNITNAKKRELPADRL
jgi:hypothetical protein